MTGRPTRGVNRPDTDTLKWIANAVLIGGLMLLSSFLAITGRYDVATYLVSIVIFLVVVDIRNDKP